MRRVTSRLLRSPREVITRAQQELLNAALFLRPPRLPEIEAPKSPLPGLPDPAEIAARLRQTAYAADVQHLAEGIPAGRIPLFGGFVDVGSDIHWRRDYASGIETGLGYFRRVPYLDASAAGDHKVVWELNRHQHLVLLAQAALLARSDAPLESVWKQLESWIADNPFHRGINWASALEVGFRALSWIWIFHLAGARMPEWLRGKFLETLYRHGRHLEINLSFYFSPNTHLLGESVALHALGKLFPAFPDARRWVQLGSQVVEEQMRRQVRPDGGHFEQSTYYHVYALDMFLFHAVLSAPSAEYRAGLARMAEYLDAVLGPARVLPMIGDDDGGRFFHPFGPREQFGRASIAACAAFLGRSDWTYRPEDLYPIASWWLGCTEGCGRSEPRSRLFRDTGIAVMTDGEHQVIMDAGPFGPWSGGHSHADTLSLIVRSGEQELLIDPGTYTYTGDPQLRDWFRGSAAHNTIRIDGRDQATAAGPFGWTGHPAVRAIAWTSVAEFDELDAECLYEGFRHRRRVRFIKSGVVLVLDEIEGPPGVHEVEQFWHPGPEPASERLVLELPCDRQEGWRSIVLGAKEPSPVLRVRRTARMPYRLAAGIILAPDGHLEIERDGNEIRFHWRCGASEPITISL